MISQPSCAGLSRASTSFFASQGVDGRYKSGHDDGELLRCRQGLNRREFITLLGGAAAAWPLAARAQAERVRRVAALSGNAADDPLTSERRAAFQKRLEQLGWKIGGNLQIDYRYPGVSGERLRADAAELIRLQPDVIFAEGTPALAAAQEATRSIPIVFRGVSDPVQQGFVTSFAHPGGNITGFTNYEFSIAGKWIELLKQFSPELTHIGFLFNPEAAPYSKFYFASMEAAAPSFSLAVAALAVKTDADIEPALSRIARQPNGGLIIATDVFLTPRRKEVVALAARYRLPAVYAQREWIEAGGLMRYGDINIEQYRGAAVYVDRILKGANPGDLPIQLPTKFELVLNLSAARGLGREFPLSLLVRADEVVE
jgi:putative ABC transport system substrate-binding protein